MLCIMELFIGKKIFLFQVMLFSCLTASSKAVNEKFKIRQSCKIKDSYSMEQNIAKSLIRCIGKCTLKTGCISVAWNSNTHVCMMSTSDTIFEVNHEYRDYEQADVWKCASLVRYPVFIALKSTYTDVYEMSFTQASDRCAELGTTLADPSDLVTAQNLGLHKCHCGWMSDGRNAVLLDYYAAACSGTYHRGPIICDYTLADAWCKLP